MSSNTVITPNTFIVVEVVHSLLQYCAMLIMYSWPYSTVPKMSSSLWGTVRIWNHVRCHLGLLHFHMRCCCVLLILFYHAIICVPFSRVALLGRTIYQLQTNAQKVQFSRHQNCTLRKNLPAPKM